MKIVFDRWPQTDDELWEFVATLWDFEIPRVSVCPDHCAPFDAFANSYFARSPVSIWKASRGLGGKSNLLGILSLTEAVTFGANISVLGGSASQSQTVHNVTMAAWFEKFAPRQLLQKEPTQFFTHLTNGAVIKALMASQTSVRGPHPLRLRMDEIDEMDLDILEAAQGQPMDVTERYYDAQGRTQRRTIHEAQTTMSSTHQYPDKTMTTMLKRARENGWPVFEWCYRESSGTKANPGWLTQEQIDRKRGEISAAMWATEYDLQEPSFEGRAIDQDKVEWAFNISLGEVEGEENKDYIFEAAIPNLRTPYITGIDWAKEQDWTIIATFRTDVTPWRCVAWRRTGRRPWPVLIGYAEARMDRYGGYLIHDNTGLGNVVGDLITYDHKMMVDFNMVGAARTEMFNEFIVAIETGEMQLPRITYAFNEHKYVTLDDLYGRGHAPDSVVANALAWSGRSLVRKAATAGAVPITIERDSSPWR